VDHIVERFLAERMAWIPMPELETLVPEAFRCFEELLTLIPFEDLAAKKYELHVDRTKGADDVPDEPDDGLILKDPELHDPSTAARGELPDAKVFFHARLDTRELLQKKLKDKYPPEFEKFLQTMDPIRSVLDVQIEGFLKALGRARPELGGLRNDREMTVIRCMMYRKQRDDGSGLAGGLHLDRDYATIHLGDTVPALVVVKPNGEHVLIPRCYSRGLLFGGKRLERRSGIPALRHGAKDNGNRLVMVAFVHFLYPNE